MSFTYITDDGSLTVPDESERPLHSYHAAIERRLDDGVDLDGLTGKGNGIRRIVVTDELSKSAKSDLEEFLKTRIKLVEEDTRG